MGSSPLEAAWLKGSLHMGIPKFLAWTDIANTGCKGVQLYFSVGSKVNAARAPDEPADQTLTVAILPLMIRSTDVEPYG
jgi:hypothetical protein